jgi:phage shock protein C
MDNDPTLEVVMSEVKRFERSERNKVIAGVCGGIGEYLDIDPTIVRLVFIVFAVAGGPGILAYIILWLVMPPGESPGEPLG